MKLKITNYFRYSFPFTSPFTTSTNTYSNRDGFIIQLKDEHNKTGFGEAAPLEGFGEESLAQAESSIGKLNDFLDTTSFKNLYDLNRLLLENDFSYSVISAVTFAVVQIVFKDHKSRTQFLSDYNFTDKTYLNGVVGFYDIDEVINRVRKLHNSGYKVIKLKVGRQNIEDDLNILEHISLEFPLVKLRLDANGAWDHNSAKQNLQLLAKYNLEYIEEPIHGIDNLMNLAEEIANESNVNLAIDESLISLTDIYRILTQSKIKNIVVKPSLFGGIINLLDLNKSALKNGKKIIISSAFETSLGRMQNAFIASLINNNCTHGIDTSEFLQNDISMNFYEVTNNFLTLDINNFSNYISEILC